MQTPAREEEIEKLGTLIKGIKHAMLTTQSKSGDLYSRPMMTQETDFDGTLWFFTDDQSPKMAELATHKKVNVAYACPSSHRYVSISGTAQIVRDPVREKLLWKPLYKAWVSKGLEDPHLALIRVDVESAEYWDSPSSPVAQIWGFAKATFTGEKAQLGENHTLHMGTVH